MTYPKLHEALSCLLLVCTIVFAGECNAALVSTQDQLGDKTIFLGGGGEPLGARVHVGRFSFPVGHTYFTEFRFRGWVDLADDELMAGSPTLVFAAINTSPFDIELGNANVITTSLSVGNLPGGFSNSVEERQSDWTLLTGGDGIRLANFVNTHGGLVDVWFISNTDPDFWFPASTTTFVGVDSDFNPILIEVPYTATVELSPVPEPISSTVFISLIATGLFLNPSRYFRERS